MNIRKVPSCEEAKKQISMVQYLAELGYQPAHINGNNYWYHSPLHPENTPSFKVNMNINCWYDWGTGEKGNLIDFGLAYHKCSTEDLLYKLSTMKFGLVLSQDFKSESTRHKTEEEKKITIDLVKELSASPLLDYIHCRRVSEKIARQFCKEVHYSLNGKHYYAIGFKNDFGGYELRNEYVKLSCSPKGPTFIDNKADDVAVFEGSFNFLSYKTLHQYQPEHQRNYLILNSTSFFAQQLPIMQSHKRCFLYLDNGKTGDKLTEQALAISKEQFTDDRKLYQGKEDFNKWWKDIGYRLKHTLTIKH